MYTCLLIGELKPSGDLLRRTIVFGVLPYWGIGDRIVTFIEEKINAFQANVLMKAELNKNRFHSSLLFEYFHRR
jgi:hypothetical protein